MFRKAMSLIGLLVLLLASFAIAPAVVAAENTPEGHWEGAINLPGMALQIQVDFKPADGGWQATIDPESSAAQSRRAQVPGKNAQKRPISTLAGDAAAAGHAVSGQQSRVR